MDQASIIRGIKISFSTHPVLSIRFADEGTARNYTARAAPDRWSMRNTSARVTLADAAECYINNEAVTLKFPCAETAKLWLEKSPCWTKSNNADTNVRLYLFWTRSRFNRALGEFQSVRGPQLPRQAPAQAAPPTQPPQQPPQPVPNSPAPQVIEITNARYRASGVARRSLSIPPSNLDRPEVGDRSGKLAGEALPKPSAGTVSTNGGAYKPVLSTVASASVTTAATVSVASIPAPVEHDPSHRQSPIPPESNHLSDRYDITDNASWQLDREDITMIASEDAVLQFERRDEQASAWETGVVARLLRKW